MHDPKYRPYRLWAPLWVQGRQFYLRNLLGFPQVKASWEHADASPSIIIQRKETRRCTLTRVNRPVFLFDLLGKPTMSTITR